MMLEQIEIEIQKLKSELINLDNELEYSKSIINDPEIKGYKESEAYEDIKYYREEIERIKKKINELNKQKDELLGISSEPSIEKIIPRKK